MTKFTSDHLEEVTKDGFLEWQCNALFTTYASCGSDKGLVELGVDGTGGYAVKIRYKNGSKTSFYKTADEAIIAYKGKF
tara:strand:- start:14 stop:250 length:237 start_codon:yes stop_codon:yes gene_type:complete